jgi:hypothetical protein
MSVLNLAQAIRSIRQLEAAWLKWSNGEPADGGEELAAWEAGSSAFCDAHEIALNSIRDMRCATVREASLKLSLIIEEMKGQRHTRVYDGCLAIAEDLAAICERPTQDAFAVKLRAHQRAVQDRDAFDAAHKPAGGEGLNEEWRAYESIMSPLHSAVFDTGKAVMLEPAPDVAALIEKRAIFDALQYDEDADAPTVTHRLFADAIALAGGVA